MVEVMLGSKRIESPFDGGAGSAAKLAITCGAGNSSVPWMKQTGNGHGARPAHPAGMAGRPPSQPRRGPATKTNAATSAPRMPMPRFAGGSGATSTAIGGLFCSSLDTLSLEVWGASLV